MIVNLARIVDEETRNLPEDVQYLIKVLVCSGTQEETYFSLRSLITDHWPDLKIFQETIFKDEENGEEQQLEEND